MNGLTEQLLEKLNNEGIQFALFIKGKDNAPSNHTEQTDTYFSNGYISAGAEQHVISSLANLVSRMNIRIYSKINQLPNDRLNFRTINLPLNNREIIQKYLINCFKTLRQVPCKMIAKLWIKIIEPGKKTKFPYIKGDSMKPNWWPQNVEHREPDHLQKTDRMYLMCTIVTDVLPQITDDRDILEDIIENTMALGMFKNDKIKKEIILAVFKISRALRRNNVRNDKISSSMEVIDLQSITKKRTLKFQQKGIPSNVSSSSKKKACKQNELMISSPESKQDDSYSNNKIKNKPTPRIEQARSLEPFGHLCDIDDTLQYPSETLNGLVSTPSLLDMLVDNDSDLSEYMLDRKSDGTVSSTTLSSNENIFFHEQFNM
ncbi:uncharacterized protein NDAI_0J01220 [Naumovozyma dairenensis CBS 421]|uniref:Subtelomeric hrmA-associated cluster protein AFUB-079030/YDR124W-like helical bundle domain-containing protein n=1 Tax=Naumovozyma dairenensis (strain ATCC 10597 / BCRC 20456 / CBS 421 / NBRC 0211 / NRRL Y-12639) TaxID=1071378 RepID=G0WGT6_NAUDC|nr:hypothetical protein NDAI_0J01220 [Naumovozyma dairenensis CBS 421]CCD27014.1 hypothetical protein NDAI_0J01220 [Naumovozyma dairenensis CBS 421]